ncbi:MAG TPA: hypothetical protein VMS93_12600, partial [Candidatus Saccharimonadales bacterium]|nr:hypothetical protein [Candidatus Saccharimonadales bacterium]
MAPAACVAAALALRLWALRFQPFPSFDTISYLQFAEAIRKGQAYVSLFPPGYPALVALFQLGVHPGLRAAGLAAVVCGALLPWPVWALARRALGAGWAWVPALAVALHPDLARLSAQAVSEPLFFLALYAGVALAAAPLSAGLLLGLAYATRPEGLVPMAALGLRQAWRGLRRASRWGGLVLLSAGFLLLAVPCWIYFHATLGHWTLSPKAAILRDPALSWRAYEPRASQAPAAAFGSGGVRSLPAAAGEALRFLPANALRHGRSLVGLWPLPLLLLALVGLGLRRGLEAVPLLQFLVVCLVGVAGAEPRYVMAAV